MAEIEQLAEVINFDVNSAAMQVFEREEAQEQHWGTACKKIEIRIVSNEATRSNNPVKLESKFIDEENSLVATSIFNETPE